jgi:nucleoside-diphosphate-sugar epimerase
VTEKDTQGGLKLPANNMILVTGGAGYIGSILVRKLLQAGYQVLCVDNLRYGGSSLVDIWDHPNFYFSRTDITRFEDVDRLLEQYPLYGIVHLAAIVGDPACKREPDLAKNTNLTATIHLLDKSVQLGIKRFIFASTCSNYGKMADPDQVVDETSPLAPVSLYAELKVAVEEYLLEKMPKAADFSPTALRFSTVYGMSPRMRFDLTVNEFSKEIALGRELVVFGEQFWRPYCHVRDFSTAILSVLMAAEDKVAYNVFNVGDSTQNFTKAMIVAELLRQIPNGKVRYVHKVEDPRDYRVNFDKIRNVLNFQITKTVPEGIHDILTSIQVGIIANPDDQEYYNIPLTAQSKIKEGEK